MESEPERHAKEWSRQLSRASPDAILRWAIGQFGEGLCVASSFGQDGLVILDLVRRLRPRMPVLFLETGYHFAETLEFRDQLKADWGLNVVDVHPELTVPEQGARYGVDLFARDPDACCAMRKVQPLDRALRGRTAWISGLRRDQHPGRAATPIVQWQQLSVGGIYKVHPLMEWSRAEVEQYGRAHDLPRHPLWDQGYPSVGCAPCTRAVRPGGTEREGRWATTGKTECGIHVAGIRPPVATTIASTEQGATSRNAA